MSVFVDAEDLIEAAYWLFDDIKKKGAPAHGGRLAVSERDAFKRAVRPLMNRPVPVRADLTPEPDSAEVTG